MIDNSDVDFCRKRGFLTLESTSRTVLWVVKNYDSLLTSEHSICSHTFRLSNILFHLTLSLNEEVFSLKVIRTVKKSLFQTKCPLQVSITLTDTLNQIELSKELKESPIHFRRKAPGNEASLQVRCTITLTDLESCQRKVTIANHYVPSLTSAELKEHLEVILDGDEENCVTIFVAGDVFRVHRTILCSNSSVFSAMFAHDTSEKITNRIDIDDLSVDTVGEILSFMYFGSTSELSLQKAIDVYTAADKYALLGLKKKCSNFLISNLSKELVLDILMLADRHGDEELKESTIQFLVNRAADIIESDEFLLFIESESKLAKCIILHVLKITSK